MSMNETELDAALAGTAYPRPAHRKLRVYAFDPQASGDLETATINDAVIALRWEETWERPLTAGPCGEYLEVIDHDPASGLFYEPVNLEDPLLLAQNGLPPSEGRPQFHQQMVYAVAMKTIRQFERALGRAIYWTGTVDVPGDDPDRPTRHYKVIPRLRIYPHALREENAYYSPEKTALLFGYFQPRAQANGDRWVFTCLSQDIIAHETTHAILHGVHRRSIQRSNLDTYAFHEGFADIVALLQHFTMTDVLEHQMGQLRGDLRRTSLLSGLASQFGRSIGRDTGSLRAALTLIEEQTKAAQISDVDKRDAELRKLRLSDDVVEPHRRGGFLVTAVFDAFVTIYERRVADLLRIASGSSRPTGAELPVDLVRRLANEASKGADHVLRMCVRALDYVPPVDMTLGEYLRAIVTADADLVPDDPLRYRVAFAQAFRRCGIIPPGSMSMAPDSLLWEVPDPMDLALAGAERTGDRSSADRLFADLLPRLQLAYDYAPRPGKYGTDYDFFDRSESLREKNARLVEHNQRQIWRWLNEPDEQDEVWERLLGIDLLSLHHRLRETERPPLRSLAWQPVLSGKTSDMVPVVEVYSARVARRAGPDGQERNQFVIQVVQKRKAFFDPKRQRLADTEGVSEPPDFWFRGGATLLVDLSSGRLRYTIRKSIRNEQRLSAERQFHLDHSDPNAHHIYGSPAVGAPAEPFAYIHRS